MRSLRFALVSLKVSPVSGDQRLTSIWQSEDELQYTAPVGMPKNLQRLSLKWVVRTSDRYSLREVPTVGSV